MGKVDLVYIKKYIKKGVGLKICRQNIFWVGYHQDNLRKVDDIKYFLHLGIVAL